MGASWEEEQAREENDKQWAQARLDIASVRNVKRKSFIRLESPALPQNVPNAAQ